MQRRTRRTFVATCKFYANYEPLLFGGALFCFEKLWKNTENENRSINGTRMGRTPPTRIRPPGGSTVIPAHAPLRRGGGEEKNMKNMFHSANLPRYTPTSVENVVIPCPLDGSVGGHFDLYPNVNLELCYDTERTFEINKRPFLLCHQSTRLQGRKYS